MPARPNPLKMVGSAGWSGLAEIYQGQITRAILRDGDTLAVDLINDGYVYSAVLQRKADDLFEGQWTCRDRGATYVGSASARLYTSSSGTFLFGEWSEEAVRYQWWAELKTVTHFPDEEGQ